MQKRLLFDKIISRKYEHLFPVIRYNTGSKEKVIMKKLLYILLALFLFGFGPAMANDKQDAINFFNFYVKSANTYDTVIGSFYSPSAKIIRQVVKPDGTTVDVDTDTATYLKQLKLGQATAKLRKYTNSYKNITAEKVPTGIKVSSLRQPKGESYWLKAYMILTKQPNGKWLITEEMMQTKEQIFLRYAK